MGGREGRGNGLGFYLKKKEKFFLRSDVLFLLYSFRFLLCFFERVSIEENRSLYSLYKGRTTARDAGISIHLLSLSFFSP